VPEARVVYVDNDPLVLAHARALLKPTPPGVTAYIDADVHRPSHIIDAAAETLDFTQPVGVMMLGVLNFVLDNTAAEVIVNHVMEAVPSGSYLVVSHATTELGGEANAEAMRFWNEHAKPPITARTGAEIARFFEGLELVEPGLVPGTQWRPDQVGRGQAAPIVPLYAGVGRKP
jgi:O-methyltransferase involved in polyketide biosynthesis